MKQLLILSGKGGTGKTTIASAFINLSHAKAYADCDVDAPNLHLIMKQTVESIETDYYGLPKAKIDLEKCISCDKCRINCRFDAIVVEDTYKVNPFACEGCGVCKVVCPTNAITMAPDIAGTLMLYEKSNFRFSTAQLKMGSGTSGKLVTEVKKQLKTTTADLAIIDGSPGIGCPVIASLSGIDLVLIVAEPTLSGMSDMERIIDTAKKFGIPMAVCINKHDINIENSDKIEMFCKNNHIDYVGTIPFDPKAVIAINRGESIVDIPCKSGEAVKKVFEQTMQLLFQIEKGKRYDY